MFIVKLGGSVITDKTKPNSFKQKTMDRLAAELQKANKQLILVHGAGSFGHILAHQYRLNDGYKTANQRYGFSITLAQVQTLNSLVLKSLHDKNIDAVSIPPHAVLTLDNHQLQHVNTTIFQEYLDRKFTPVAFGDVVLDKTLGFSICSGDLLTQVLASCFKPEKVIFTIDEDGLYSSNPKTDKNAEFIETASSQDLETYMTPANTHADVTKGMKGKLDTIKTIATLGIDTVLVNGNKHNRLYDILIGNDTKHTLIRGGKQ
jgi:isopentenyl phosphate kinase